MNQQTRIAAPSVGILDAAHLASIAGEFDVAGDGLFVRARMLPSDDGKAELLARASACYGAAYLIRKAAE